MVYMQISSGYKVGPANFWPGPRVANYTGNGQGQHRETSPGKMENIFSVQFLMTIFHDFSLKMNDDYKTLMQDHSRQ